MSSLQHVVVEAFYDGAWQDITAMNRVRLEPPIRVTRGASEGQAAAPPAKCVMRWDNSDGWANPQNPSSPLYGAAGRYMPVRVWCGGETHTVLDDQFNRSVSNSWAGGLVWALSGGTSPDDYDVNGAQATQTSTSTGVLRTSMVDTGCRDGRYTGVFRWSAGTMTGGSASVWVLGRATDVNNYYAAVATVSTAGAVTLNITRRKAGVGTTIAGPVTTHGGYSGLLATYYFAVQLYIDGDEIYAKIWDYTNDAEPPVWNLHASDGGSAGVSTGNLGGVASRRETGNTNVNLAAVFDSFRCYPGPAAFAGEVAGWAPEYSLGLDPANNRGDSTTVITAYGITSRIGQGTGPILPAYTRQALNGWSVEVWPLDDLEDSQQARSARVGGVPMVAQRTLVDFTDLHPPGMVGSVAPSLDVGNALVGPLSGFDAAGTNDWNMAFWFRGKAGTQTTATSPYVDPVFVWERGTNIVWFFRIASRPNTQAILVLRTVAGSGVTAPAVDYTAADLLDDQWHLCQIAVFGGATPAVELYVDGVLVDSASDGAPPAAQVVPDRAEVLGIETGTAVVALDIDHFNMAGLAFFSFAFPDLTLYDAGMGWPGELAGDRLTRLGSEYGFNAWVWGGTDTQPMGPQWSDTLMGHLREIEATDFGLLLDARHDRGVGLITGQSRYNRPATLTLDFDAGYVSAGLRPDIGGVNVRNDVTAERRNGSKVQRVKTTGPNNTSDPMSDPEGVGTVSTTAPVNPETDASLGYYADRIILLNTLDEPRFPQIGVEMSAPDAAAIVDDVARVDVGHALAIANLPDMADTQTVVVVGYEDEIGNNIRRRVFNVEPARGYRRFRLGVDVLSPPSGTVTSGSFVAGVGTSLGVTVATTAPFTAADLPQDIMVYGVRLRVTGVSGSAPSQTLTVQATPVNGVTKTIPAGKRVSLYDPAYLGL